MAGWALTASQALLLAADATTEGAAPGVVGAGQWVVAGVVACVLFGMFFAVLFTTRAGIIGRAAAKEAIRQPMFPLLLGLSLLMLVVNTFIPFFSLGDDVKMLEICGLATMLICGMLLAIWTSSMSIADEIEGKTAMTLLSKPINRRQFIVGKFLGIQAAVLALLVPVVICFCALVYYKVYYDARESSTLESLTAGTAVAETLRILPGAALVFLEITIMSAISVAISTRLPMVVNMVTCLAIFVVGHLTPSLVGANLGKLEPVMFIARMIAIVLPAVENFNIESALVTGRMVPPDYIGWTALYSAAYATMAIILAFMLFEDRDLA